MLSFAKKHINLKSLGISTVVMFLTLFAFFSGLLPVMDIMELRTIDLRFQFRGKVEPGPEVVIAAVDEKSIDREGRWPWPRSKIAQLIETLSRAGAKVIAFDIGFLEPDRREVVAALVEVEQFARRLEIGSEEFEKFIVDLKYRSDNDQQLADTIENSDARIVLGYFFHTDQKSAGHLDEQRVARIHEDIKNSRYGFIRYSSQKARSVMIKQAAAPQPNIPKLSQAANYAGYFNMTADPDGVVRRIDSLLKYGDDLYAPLSVMAVSAYLEQAPSVFVSEHGVELVRIGELTIPTDELGHVMINYRGPQKTFPHISVTDILSGKAKAESFRNKIVLVGVTAVAVFDLRVTPFGEVFPGLEIHANVVDNLLAQDTLFQPTWFWIFDSLAIIFFCLALGYYLPKSDDLSGGMAAFGMFFAYIAICLFLFYKVGWVLSMIYPLSAIILTYVGIITHRYLSESRLKRFVKDTFSTFVSPEVVQQLIESNEKVELGGEEREITAFFSDVQGFTTISENLQPNELVELLNEFLTEMADIIMKHKGMVDKFEGDAIIAIFGAPSELSNHSEAACLASIEMQKRLEQLRSIWKTQDKPELRMRIGLNSGTAVVGNMGSRNRMDYTMMGDTVNTAARLEGVNKVYGTYTLIGESTYRMAGDWIVTREIDAIKVVGKSEPVKIYELLGYPDDMDENLFRMVEYYTRGLYAYRSQDWNRAIILFNKCLQLHAEDGPSKVMLKRSNYLKIHPPSKRWDGSFTMKTK